MSAREPSSQTDRGASWRRVTDTVFSIQCKSTVFVVVLTLTVTAAVSGYLLRSSVRVVREMHDEQATNLCTLLAHAAVAPLERGDRDALVTLARERANGSPLKYVIITDPEGRTLATAEHGGMRLLKHLRLTGSGRPTPHARPVLLAATAQTPPLLDLTYPIGRRRSGASNGSVALLGYVRVGLVVDRWQRSMAHALDLVTGIGILAAVIAIPFGFYLIRRVLAPLDELADAMHQFSRGRLDIRSNVRRANEIGRLAAAFNRMADQHQYTHERILKLNTDLEVRVAQRTRQLREIASREPLTGLYNRRYFNEVFERGVNEAVRYESDISCVMIDLDDFKQVNDKFGHHAGDELLIMIGNGIKTELRGADVAARFGGDEFVLMLPQTEQDKALVLAERIVEGFTEAVRERFPDTTVSMSVGIACLRTSRATSADALLRAADQAMYKAKSSGKNRIMLAGPAGRTAKAVP